MDYLSGVMLLCVVAFNIAVLLISVLFNASSLNCSRKTAKIVTLIALSLNMVFNVVFIVCFVVCDMFDNLKVFALFLPLACWLLYDAIIEAKRK